MLAYNRVTTKNGSKGSPIFTKYFHKKTVDSFLYLFYTNISKYLFT